MSWQCRWLLPALAFGLLLTFFPALDIAASELFFTPTDGFYLSRHPLVLLVYRSESTIVATTVVVLSAILLLGLLPQAAALKRQRKAALYLLLVLIIGPGLVVAGLKDHWGRARPVQIEAFGGPQRFTPALLPSDQCARNCAFVSGHASIGFYFTAIGFVAARRRRLWLASGVVLGSTVGFVRIVQGGHFLSDVVFAFCFLFVTAWIVRIILDRLWREPRQTETRPA